jgi:hypothetical protein
LRNKQAHDVRAIDFEQIESGSEDPASVERSTMIGSGGDKAVDDGMNQGGNKSQGDDRPRRRQGRLRRRLVSVGSLVTADSRC